jgi:predicted TIM-barrel fold metal-dependent hydrolase
MIIDFHAHAFPDDLARRAIDTLIDASDGLRAHTGGTRAALCESMRMAGIDRSVVLPVATKPSQVRGINQRAADERDDRLIAFGALHPKAPLAEIEREIAFLAANGIPGIKLHPEYQDFYLDAPEMRPVFDMLQDAGLMVVCHAGMDPGPFTCDHALPEAFVRLVRDFPRLVMIAAHMGGWRLWDEAAKIIAGKPLLLDTAAVSDWLAPEQFIAIVNRHGAENVLFGTDSPWYDQKAVRSWIESLALSDRVKSLILGENARALLHRCSQW